MAHSFSPLWLEKQRITPYSTIQQTQAKRPTLCFCLNTGPGGVRQPTIREILNGPHNMRKLQQELSMKILSSRWSWQNNTFFTKMFVICATANSSVMRLCCSLFVSVTWTVFRHNSLKTFKKSKTVFQDDLQRGFVCFHNSRLCNSRVPPVALCNYFVLQLRKCIYKINK